MKKNIKLTVAYDGSSFFGWQKTEKGPSIEGSLEEILKKILQENVNLQAASRTDRGVHAHGQVINFLTEKDNIHPLRLQQSMNALLPLEIRVLNTEEVPLAFHPTLDSVEKEYRYFICNRNTQLPVHRFFSWHVPYDLDLASIQEAIPFFLGTQDFSALCNQRKNLTYPHKIRTISDIQMHFIENDRIQIEVKGENFLYKMVRNLIGTLIFIGRGKINVRDINHFLQSKQRALLGMTAPAHGLFLWKIFYPHLIPNPVLGIQVTDH